MHFDADTFLDLIARAVASLPQQFRSHMQNVTIDVEPLPDRRTCHDMDLDSPYELLGLYHGVPLTERHVEGVYFPDRITIYQKSIEASCDDPDQAIEQIRHTVLHEVGHFFGMTEDDLDRLGYG